MYSCHRIVAPVRLVDGRHPDEGRVEVYFNGAWGTVCAADWWDDADARVVCRQLGYPNDVSAIAYSSAYFGEGSGDILLDDVQCTGSEVALSLCTHDGWSNHNWCYHSEDAGVACGCK